MRAADFWDDQDQASRVSAEYSRLKRRLDEFAELEGRFADLETTEELLREELSGDAVDDELLQELVTGVAVLEADLQRGEELRFFSGKYDEGGAILTIHPGAGGTESQDWAEMLLRMYLRWFERRGFKVEINDQQEGDEAGLKSATLTVEGENVYGLIQAERGVHRLVRMSPFDSANRRHTSFVSVDASPLVSDDVDVEIDEDDLRIDTYRSSGAGGQHVNKTSSAIRITHLPTNIVVQCQNERSQLQNKTVAMHMLKSKLVELEEQQAEPTSSPASAARCATSTSAARSAATCCTPIRWSRTCARATRSATPRACSTAIWTASCTSTWCGARRAARRESRDGHAAAWRLSRSHGLLRWRGRAGTVR